MFRAVTRSVKVAPPVRQTTTTASSLLSSKHRLNNAPQQRIKLSTSAALFNNSSSSKNDEPPRAAKPGDKPGPSGSASGDVEVPKFSFEGLGVSKNMKILIYVLVGILGTMETITYVKMIHRWWYGDAEAKDTSPGVRQ